MRGARDEAVTVATKIDCAGFAILPEIFQPTEVAKFRTDLLSAPFERSRAGARHVLGSINVVRIATDPRVIQIVRQVLGPDARPFRATLFDKSPVSNWLVAWHQDRALPLTKRHDLPGWGPWSVKAGISYAHAPAKVLEQILAVRIHLDDSNQKNGPLRVLPGSHTLGVLDGDAIGNLASKIAAVDCLVKIGGLVAMRPLIVHASSKSLGETPRRVLHIEYAVRLQLINGLELALA